jgi:hypothetical protein
VAPGDDEFTALRKAYKKLRGVQRNIAESRQDHVMRAYLAFKDVLLDAVRALKRENDL